jgi:diaminohydroxyphosphoribosylaminopyrimidine deaminase / 5-amino-6-(5-phosphoribosylamino)uracil reductase
MRRAVDLAKQSQAEERADPPPRVGVVIARDDELLGESFRGETGPGRHAEFGLLERLRGTDLTDAEVYTTLEPCSRRNHPKTPCARHLIESRVRAVYIGIYDPNPRIYREGWRMLRDAGIEVWDFAPELRTEIVADNDDFLRGFRLSRSAIGEASFDYRRNHGEFLVDVDGTQFATKWSQRAADSVWAYDHSNGVAQALHAHCFAEIDDPAALDFSSASVPARVAEIVVFRDSDRSHPLVQIEEVHAGPERGADRTELQIRWEARTPGTSRPGSHAMGGAGFEPA